MPLTFEERPEKLKKARVSCFLFSVLLSILLFFLFDEVIAASGFVLEGQSLLFLRVGLPLIFPLFSVAYFLIRPRPDGSRAWRRGLAVASFSMLFPAVLVFLVCFHRSWGNPVYWVGAGYLALLAWQVAAFAGLALHSDAGSDRRQELQREISFLLAGFVAAAALGLYTAGPLLFAAERAPAGGALQLRPGSAVLLPAALVSIIAYAAARICSPGKEKGLRFVVPWALSLAAIPALLPMGFPSLKLLGAVVLASVSVALLAQAKPAVEKAGVCRRFFPVLAAAGLVLLSPAWIPAALAILMYLAGRVLPPRKTAKTPSFAVFYTLSALFLFWAAASHFGVLTGGLRQLGANLWDLSFRPSSGLFFYLPALLAGFFFLGPGRGCFIAAFLAGLAAAAFRVGFQTAEASAAEILPYAVLLLPGLGEWLDGAGGSSRRYSAAAGAGWTLLLSALALLHYPMAYIGVSESGPLSRVLPDSLGGPGGIVDSTVVFTMALVALAFLFFVSAGATRGAGERKGGGIEAAVVFSIAALMAFQYQATASAARRARAQATVALPEGFQVSAAHRRGSISVPFPGRKSKEIFLLSALSHSRDVEQGARVGVLTVHAEGGRSLCFPVRAGLETAEWSFDRRGAVSVIRHRRPRIGFSMPRPGTTGDGFFRVYYYLACFRLPEETVVESVDFDWTLPAGPGDSASFFARSLRLIEDSP
jgi:hypothetical protein